MTYDVKGCLVNAPDKKLVVLQGLEDYIVVETDDVLLVCRVEDEQRIKNIVNDVRIQKGGHLHLIPPILCFYTKCSDEMVISKAWKNLNKKTAGDCSEARS